MNQTGIRIAHETPPPGKDRKCSAWAAYLVAFLATSLFVLVWNFVVLSFDRQDDAVFSPGNRLGFAVIIYFATGFFPGLILLSLPWSFAVRLYRQNWTYGIMYFPLVASFTLLLVCSALYARAIQAMSLAPPYAECLVSAVEKQGSCFICSGIVFGLIYRALAEVG